MNIFEGKICSKYHSFRSRLSDQVLYAEKRQEMQWLTHYTIFSVFLLVLQKPGDFTIEQLVDRVTEFDYESTRHNLTVSTRL